jgi:4-hydroxybenzoate polyprenyltransferase
MFLMAMLLAGRQFELGMFFHGGLVAATVLFVHQETLTRGRTPEGCFEAFLNNHRVGAAVFAGIFLHYLFN